MDDDLATARAERTMQAWRTHRYGTPLDVLQLDEVPIPEPGPGEVRVEVHAIPLNLNDLERITGGPMMVAPELPSIPGMEVMGVVDACGPGAEEWSGRRVVAMPVHAHGGYAEHALCPAAATFDMPATIPLPDAAALLFPFHLAWIGLVERAELAAGETVLVHAGAGGSGSAAIQLARHLGARVIATAGSAAKLERCRELGAHVAIDAGSADLAATILDETGGRGVDVVFDNVGAAVFDASLHATAYNGRYLMMGFASDKAVADEPFVVPRRLALGNVKLCGVLLAYAADDVRALVKGAMGWNFASTAQGAATMGEIVALVESGAVHAAVDRVVDFASIPEAITALAARETTGRTVALTAAGRASQAAPTIGPPV